MRPFRPLVVLGVVAFVLAGCGTDPVDDLDVEDVSENVDETTEEDADAAAEPADDVDASTPEAPDAGDGADAGTGDDADGAADEPDDGSDGDGGTSSEASAGPQPDAALLADPCGPHADRDMEAFIELVSPVQDQVVGDAVALVGCANVHEATVAWELYDGDGRLLDEGFTTATCGTGCVGEFDDTVDLSAAAGEPVGYLQVFSPNMADEGDRQLQLVEVLVVIDGS